LALQTISSFKKSVNFRSFELGLSCKQLSQDENNKSVNQGNATSRKYNLENRNKRHNIDFSIIYVG
jgi:hypothetical protein